ncbi:MAG: hypothetical protein HRF45_04185 [Fimbriimonadia bacterium]|jgi:hypothetical protein
MTSGRRERGSALLIALITVVIGATVGVAVLEFASSAYARSVRDSHLQCLRNIAEAGIEHARYEMAAQQATSVSVSGSCAGGTYAASTVMESRPSGSVKVTSTATLREKALTITRVIGPGFRIPRPFDYALAVNGFDWDDQAIRTGQSGTTSSVRLNGDLTWVLGSSVNGNLLLSGRILGYRPPVTGTTVENAPSLWFPAYSIADYQAIGIVYTGNLTLPVAWFVGNNLVIVVTGNLTLNGGTTSGSGIIVVGGTLRFRNSANRFGTGSRWVYLASKVMVDDPVRDLDGFFYTPGVFETKGTLNVVGSIACRELVTGGSLRIDHDPAFVNDPDLGWTMKVPSYWP